MRMSNAQSASEGKGESEEKVRRLEAEIDELKKRLAELEQENKELKTQLARACRTSRNSSKPPSSDIVKPARAAFGSKRHIGAQPGHKKHERPPFTAEEIDRFISYAMDCCPDCHGPVHEYAGLLPSVVQQMELVVRPIEITEHKAPWYWCAKCQKVHCSLPPAVDKGGLCGPLLTAWIGYLKGGCHASFSTIRKFLRDVLGVRVCRGMLAKVIAKVSAALAEPWEELRLLLPLAKHSQRGRDRAQGEWAALADVVFPGAGLHSLQDCRDARHGGAAGNVGRGF